MAWWITLLVGLVGKVLEVFLNKPYKMTEEYNDVGHPVDFDTDDPFTPSDW